MSNCHGKFLRTKLPPECNGEECSACKPKPKELTPREKADLMMKATTHAGMMSALGLKPLGYWATRTTSRSMA